MVITSERVPKDLSNKHQVMFTVGGKKPTDAPKVRSFWQQLTERECKGVDKPKGRCLVTGDYGYLERVLPGTVSVPYVDKKSGRLKYESAPLNSVDSEAGWSFGFVKSLNGGVSLRAAEGFTQSSQSSTEEPRHTPDCR